MRDPFEAASLALGTVPLEAPAPPGAVALPLEAQARLVGAYQWVERRLFEVLGAWGSSEVVPEVQVLFDVYSQQHAWHAELFAERLPVLDSLDPAALVVPPNAEVDRMLSELSGGARPTAGSAVTGRLMGEAPAGSGGSGGSGGTLLRLVGLARAVLPRLVTGYVLHLRRAAPVAEAPLARSLRLVLRDEAEQWQATEALAQTLLRRPHDIAVVTAHQQRLEELVAETGAGLVPWPDGQTSPESLGGPPSV